jgi:NADPH:quinone reductase-like Zn-dependent oxidoreductase
MKAAVVHAFDQPPQYREFDEPIPREGEVKIRVQAAALSQLVRAVASGKHYSANGSLPFVPGVDGVGRLADGRRVYFAFPRAPFGALAESVAVDAAHCVPVPDELDDVTAAALANPGMSSWAALTQRAQFQAGESVLINGATGASGRLAIQVAKHLGARRVIATGRNGSSEASLRALGADAFVPLDLPPQTLQQAFQDQLSSVDVVLDYMWGASAESILAAATGPGRGAAARRLRFVQIGSVGGAHVALSAASLRSSGLELLGSGFGSLSKLSLITAIRALLQVARPAGFHVQAEPVPLSQVERAWNGTQGSRLVFTVD